MEVDGLPRSVVVNEILPKMTFDELSRLARTAIVYKDIVREEIDRRINNNDLDLDKYNLNTLYNMGTNPRIKWPVIQEILNRLRPEVQKSTIFSSAPKVDTKNLKSKILKLRELLPDKLDLIVDGIPNSVSKDGAYGLLLGLIVTNTLKNHVIKLHDIVMDELNIEILFYQTVSFILAHRYWIKLDTTWKQALHHGFNDMDFISSLKVSGVKVDRIYDKKNPFGLQPSYQG